LKKLILYNLNGHLHNLFYTLHISLTLPRSKDTTKEITQLLTGYSIGSEDFLASGIRPRPTITYPGHTEKQFLQAGENQTLLIRGNDLWRSPQVFVGSQKATSIDVLSDMKGLLAHFTNVYYPGDPQAKPKGGLPVDLRVITSFDEDVVEDVVTILPAGKEREEKSATLLTPYIDDQNKFLEFSYKQPDEYYKIFLETQNPDLYDTTIVTAMEGSWNKNKNRIRFQYNTPCTNPELLYADLILIAKEGADKMSVIGDKPAVFAHFKDKTSRSATLINNEEVIYDKSGKVKDGIKIKFSKNPQNIQQILYTAYPGLQKSIIDKNLFLTFWDSNKGISDLKLPLNFTDKDSELVFEVLTKTLKKDKIRQELTTTIKSPHEVQIEYVAWGGKNRYIPVISNTNNTVSPGKLKFTQTPSKKEKAKLLETRVEFDKTGKPSTCIDLTLLKSLKDKLEVDYPGFKNAIALGRFYVTLHNQITADNFKNNGLKLKIKLIIGDKDYVFRIEKDTLEAFRDKLIDRDKSSETRTVKIKLHFDYLNKKYRTIETVSADGSGEDILIFSQKKLEYPKAKLSTNEVTFGGDNQDSADQSVKLTFLRENEDEIFYCYPFFNNAFNSNAFKVTLFTDDGEKVGKDLKITHESAEKVFLLKLEKDTLKANKSELLKNDGKPLTVEIKDSTSSKIIKVDGKLTFSSKKAPPKASKSELLKNDGKPLIVEIKGNTGSETINVDGKVIFSKGKD